MKYGVYPPRSSSVSKHTGSTSDHTSCLSSQRFLCWLCLSLYSFLLIFSFPFIVMWGFPVSTVCLSLTESQWTCLRADDEHG